ncbi:MAG: PAS domain S-box protein [Desulfuromonadales bacterium]|nr:PAS domain S-box protein [Desulfuromonadales bacterium]
MQSGNMQGMTIAPLIGGDVSAEEQSGSLHLRGQPISSVFELAPIPMVLTSLPEGVFLEVNREFLRKFGFSREEVIGKTTVELDMWVNLAERNRYLRMISEEHHVNAFEATMRIKAGDVKTVRCTGSLVDMDGKSHVLNTIFDITDQKNAETALQESERRFRNFFEQSGDAFLILDDGLFIDCNTAAIRSLGYDDKHGIVLHSPAEISPELQPDGRLSAEKTSAMVATAFSEGGHRFEWMHLKADGSELPVEVSLTPMSLGGKRLLHVIWRDISERKQLELREQTRLAILEKMATGAALTCLLDAIVTFVEKNSPGALCSILIANDEGTRLFHGAAPSLPDFYNEAVNGLKIKQGKGACGTAAFLKKRVVVDDLQGHPYWKGFEPAIQAGLCSCWSEPVLSSEGELLGTFATYHREPRSPSRNEIALIESAAHLASIAIGRARDNERRNSLEEHVRQMQKIEAIGQLAGGIAHDFNNLLTPILGYAEMVSKSLGQDHPCLPKVKGIVLAANKSKDLVKKLLSFCHKQNLIKTHIDLNSVIDSFKDIIRRTVRANISLELSLAPGGAHILADQGQMEQILLNLSVNAQDAIEGNGAITIETGHVFFDDEYVKFNPGVQPGAYVLLAFSDDGCGMTDEVMRHIFEPFYTTKATGRGTGLGLATTFGIIGQHDGHIKVRSEVGKGTTFSMYFPENISSGGTLEKPMVEHRQHAQLDKTILFIDDNEMILDMARIILEMNGYTVLLDSTPSKALDIATSHEGSIDLLITDVVMPEMNGPELYERLLAIYPKLPVLYISGYKDDVVLRGGAPEEDVVFVPKPFTSEQLLGRIEQILYAEIDEISDK